MINQAISLSLAVILGLAATVVGAEVPAQAAGFASVAAVAPEERFTIGVQFTMAKGWHTYAEDPGDSGMPPAITIKGPVKHGNWRFPPATTFTDAAGTTYGYENQVLLLCDVQLQEAASPTATITLELDVAWMVCRDMCIPLNTQLQLQIPVQESGTIANPAWKQLLQAGGWATPANNQTPGT